MTSSDPTTTRRAFRPVAAVHGHYVVESSEPEDARLPLVVGFHGYAETAKVHLQALRQVPGVEAWRRCAVQALHPFYRAKTGEVVASWMTRFDRDLARQDNLDYVAGVLGQVRGGFPTRRPTAFVGFSQGVAMAYRAAAAQGADCQGLVALGGDVPPDLADEELTGFPRVLIARGSEDPWYSGEKLQADVELLRGRGVSVEVCAFDGGHEWSPAFLEAAGGFLSSLGPKDENEGA